MTAPDDYLSWVLGETYYSPNEEQIDKYFIVSLSGGKDSTALLLKLLEHDILIHEVVYVDVGKEFPEMIQHIKKLKKIVEAAEIKFTILKPEKNFRYWLGEHIKTKGKNIGKKGYGWPDFRNRWCTSQMKIETLKKYYLNLINNKNTVEFVGYAADEIERINNNKDKRIKEYSLVNFDMTEKAALEYCYSKGFDWNGLYEKFNRASCYLCPLSRLSELKYVFENYPHLWLEMRMLDDMSFRDFRSDYTLKELEKKFINEFYEDMWGRKQLKLNFLEEG